MQIVQNFVELILHLERHLTEIVAQYGALTYAILFAIIFLETGVVIMPFLPGDSLLFAAGAFAAKVPPPLHIGWLWVLLTGAAILGDTVNYAIGKRIGARAFSGQIRFLKPQHLQRTHAFFEKYGPKTIVLARFVPIVRTFAPFVAGVGAMTYGRFLTYNVVGALAWTTLLLGAGYFFGNLPLVQRHFSFVILAIIVLSMLPMVWEWWMVKREVRRSRSDAKS